MQVGSVADAHLCRAVDVALKATGLGHRQQLLRLHEAAGLGVVEGHHLRRLPSDQSQYVVSVPGAFVGHDGHVGVLGHPGHVLQALDRLFHVPDVVVGKDAGDSERLLPGAVALVGVNPDAHIGERLADAFDQVDIPLGIVAHLDLDASDALVDDLLCGLHGLVRLHQADGVSHRHLAAHQPAQELINRQAVYLAHRIVHGHVEGCLGVGVALDKLVHLGVEVLDPADVLANDQGRQVLVDDDAGAFRRLAELGAVLAAPVL